MLKKGGFLNVGSRYPESRKCYTINNGDRAVALHAEILGSKAPGSADTQKVR